MADENPIRNGNEERRSLERRLQCLETFLGRIDERQKAEASAVAVAKKEVDRRLTEMNEMRRQISEERGQYVDRKEYEVKYETLNVLIRETQKFVWMGIGGLAAMQVLGAFIIHYWHGP